MLCVRCLITEHPSRVMRRAITVYEGNALCEGCLRDVAGLPALAGKGRLHAVTQRSGLDASRPLHAGGRAGDGV